MLEIFHSDWRIAVGIISKKTAQVDSYPHVVFWMESLGLPCDAPVIIAIFPFKRSIILAFKWIDLLNYFPEFSLRVEEFIAFTNFPFLSM